MSFNQTLQAEKVLSAINLVKTFGGVTATQNVTLHIHRGDRHALIGPNGAGKTTLINLLTGVLTPTSGNIELLGKDITNLAPNQRVQRGLVRTFQINQLFDSLTPLETLSLVVAQQMGQGSIWYRALGGPRDASRRNDQISLLERVEQLLEQFNLTDVMNIQTALMSYGKRRLLEMAIALACNPKILLLDEPVAGVPAGERDELLSTVANLPTDVSILLIEHDMDLVFNFARQMTVLVNGAVLTQGTPAQIANDAQVKAVYLGQTQIEGHTHA